MSESEQPMVEAIAEIVHETPAPLEPHPFEGVSAPSVVCPTCQHTAPYEGDPSQSILTCDQCGTRIAYGVAMPRLVIEPSADKKFVALRFSGVAIRDRAGNRVELADILIDPPMAKQLGLNVLSIV